MNGLTRDGRAGPVSRDQIIRRVRGRGNVFFPVQLTTSRIGNHTVDPYSAMCDDSAVVLLYLVVCMYVISSPKK